MLVLVLDEGISSTSTTGGIRRPAQLGAEVSKSQTLAPFQDRKASREDKILRAGSTKKKGKQKKINRRGRGWRVFRCRICTRVLWVERSR